MLTHKRIIIKTSRVERRAICFYSLLLEMDRRENNSNV